MRWVWPAVFGLVACGDGADGGLGSDQVRLNLRVIVPSSTPPEDIVYVTGSFQGWEPESPDYALAKTDVFRHEISLVVDRGATLELEFVRQGGVEEKGYVGQALPSHTLVADESTTHTFTVARWADSPPRRTTIVGDVRVFDIPEFLNGRAVLVYLPPGYDESSDRYPVLYMLDGQNVFDAETSFAGEWGVDESLENMIRNADMTPLMVVAIDNAGTDRIHEYTPWTDPDFDGRGELGGGGPAFVEAIVETLKPAIDAAFRTRPGPADTGFCGSSLGGLMSVFAAYARPDVFGRIGALSPSVWWNDQNLLTYIESRPRPDVWLWTDMGTAEGQGALDGFRALRQTLIADGFSEDDDLMTVEEPGAIHNEVAWRARFPRVVRFLFDR